MNLSKKGNNGTIACIESSELLISDAGSALDLAMTISYESDLHCLVLNKSCIAEDFFILSTGLAGNVLQKYINYGIKLAIVGDFSVYTSKPLHDFIYESNHGTDFFFVGTEAEAIEKLENACTQN